MKSSKPDSNDLLGCAVEKYQYNSVTPLPTDVPQ